MADTLQILRTTVKDKFQIDPRAWNRQLDAIASEAGGLPRICDCAHWWSEVRRCR
ncbi:hypothetical protein CPB86DRAFT_792209 [Serendipita vermifera]|nr:hypothetical protein CPB86DRAFT_792209 [Serendipita vermifera]